MDMNQLLAYGGGAGGSLLLLVVRYMVKHAGEISKAVIEMTQAIKGHDKSIDDLKAEISEGFKQVHDDIASLRQENKAEVRDHEMSMHRKH